MGTYIFYTQLYFKSFTYINLSPCMQRLEQPFSPFYSWTEKSWVWESLKSSAQGHTARKWQSQEDNSGDLVPKPTLSFCCVIMPINMNSTNPEISPDYKDHIILG